MSALTLEAAGTAADGVTRPILEIRNVTRYFGGVRATDNLSLAIAPGELHCMIGPNGAGKSTLFKLLMGTIRPTKGQIFFNGEDVTRLPPHERARRGLGIKFQNMQVYSDLTVFQNLFIPLRRHHAPATMPALVAEILDRIHLSGLANEVVHNLSHGQQQWLSIGMSIALEPRVLLLDEPAAGMGREETHSTTEIIKSLNADGMTIIVIEHDMEFIRNLGSRTSVLHLGALFAQGRYEEIETNDDVRKIYLGKA
ncbi:ABC transporter ATP-binding protein [Defluviimonas sp. SAOS-178_SWC]|uniref:ABC transporter ATP-binding protein n=1 Tax=Defluviimonas sp. SAOS-178_SWC TaxID=3121287 RepID=UPI0032216264